MTEPIILHDGVSFMVNERWDFEDYVPNQGTYLNGSFATESIGDKSRTESTKPGTTRHGGCDTTLNIVLGAEALALFVMAQLVELA